MHLKLDYPDAETEQKILRLTRGEVIEGEEAMPTPLTQAQLFAARKQVMQIYLDDAVENYLVQLVIATRQPANYDSELARWIAYGASPRATIALERCARASAWLDGRDFVTPDDINSVVHNCLRHRIIISYQAEADGVTPDQVIDKIVTLVPAP